MCSIVILLSVKSIESILWWIVLKKYLKCAVRREIGSVCQWAKHILVHDCMYMLFMVEDPARIIICLLVINVIFLVYFVIEWIFM